MRTRAKSTLPWVDSEVPLRLVLKAFLQFYSEAIHRLRFVNRTPASGLEAHHLMAYNLQ
jgi:hypothetical protein